MSRGRDPVAGTAISLLFLLLLVAGVQAADWKVSGEAGAETDLLGEEFGSGTLFDATIDPNDPLDETAGALRFRDASTRTSGVLSLRCETWGESWFQGRGELKASPSRTRGDLDLQGGHPTAVGTLAFSELATAQGGEDEPGGGVLNVLNLSWSRDRFPLGFRVRLSGTHEVSRAGSDSLARLFDYHTLRGWLQLRRDLGWRGSLSVRGGIDRKEIDADAAGAYRSSWVEGDWNPLWTGRRQLGLTCRAESRRYAETDSLTPSYQENTLNLRAESPLLGPVTSLLEVDGKVIAYAIDSSVFRDHWQAKATLRFEIDPGGGAEELAGGIPLDIRTWSLSAGPGYELLRNERVPATDYDALSFLFGASRDATRRLWFDLAGEVGRRRYRSPSEAQGIAFEGLDLSLTGTDYTFVSTSLLAETKLPAGTRLKLFGQFDREIHESRADDFTLWALTASLTREF